MSCISCYSCLESCTRTVCDNSNRNLHKSIKNKRGNFTSDLLGNFYNITLKFDSLYLHILAPDAPSQTASLRKSRRTLAFYTSGRRGRVVEFEHPLAAVRWLKEKKNKKVYYYIKFRIFKQVYLYTSFLSINL